MTESVGFISDPPSWDNRDRMRIQDYGDHGFTRMLQVIPEAAVFDHDEDYASGLDAMLSGLQDMLTERHRQRLLDRPSGDDPEVPADQSEGLLLNDVKSV